MRQQESMITENMKLKKEQSEMNKKFDELLHIINDKMTLMTDALKNVTHKETTIIVSKEQDFEKPQPTINSSSPIFIPSANTNDLKMNMNDIKKKKSLNDLGDTLSKLSELNKSSS